MHKKFYKMLIKKIFKPVKKSCLPEKKRLIIAHFLGNQDFF